MLSHLLIAMSHILIMLSPMDSSCCGYHVGNMTLEKCSTFNKRSLGSKSFVLCIEQNTYNELRCSLKLCYLFCFR